VGAYMCREGLGGKKEEGRGGGGYMERSSLLRKSLKDTCMYKDVYYHYVYTCIKESRYVYTSMYVYVYVSVHTCKDIHTLT